MTSSLHISLFSIKILVLILLISVGFLSCSENSTNSPVVNKVTAKITYVTAPVKSNGVVNIAYEIDFSDFTKINYELTSIDVLDSVSKKVIFSYKDTLLTKMLKLASVPPPTAAELQSGTD